MYNTLCMAHKNYHRMLYEAKQDLAGDLVERQKLDERIARKHAVVSELQHLCAELEHKRYEKQLDGVIKANLKGGITESARAILQENFFPMTASDLKKSIEERKYNLRPYKNPLAVIHTILKRLVQSGEVRAIPQAGGKKAYQWISSADKLLSEIQNSNQLAKLKHGKSTESK
jgi:hypothetical protein